MKHKGKTLKEITTPQVFDPPKEMLVWDNVVECNEPRIQTVYAVIQKATGTTQAIGECCRWSHCAEIPEEPKARRATNMELGRWLAQGNGEKLYDNRIIETNHKYDSCNESKPVNDYTLIRKLEDTEWHEPTVDYMDIEDTKPCGKMLYFTEPDYFKKTEVKIGNQVWMNKNLNVDDCGEGIFFNNDNGEYYYTWVAAKRIADKIPGWHLPSVKEWDELLEATGGDGVDLRVESWNGTNRYGFSAVPAGRWDNGASEVGSYARFWTSLQLGSYGINRNIDSYTCVYEGYYSQKLGLSVRLVKDM